MDKKNIKKLTYILSAILIVILFFLLQIIVQINSYYSTILCNIFIYVLFAVSLNITVGLMGQLSLGHAGFIAVGAYSSVMFTKYIFTSVPNDAVRLILGCIIGGLFAALFGFLVGIPILRLKGDYLAIITLAFGEMIKFTIQNLDFLGGAAGIRRIPQITTFTSIFWIVVICIIIITMIMTSRYGRLVLSIREDEIAAENIGIPINKIKLFGFTISAMFAGVGGALLAHSYPTLEPLQFNFVFSIDILVMVVLGGLGSITGAIVSASLLTILNESLRSFANFFPSNIGMYVQQGRYAFYALVLIFIMIFRPSGLLGTGEFRLNGIIKKLFPGKKNNEARKG